MTARDDAAVRAARILFAAVLLVAVGACDDDDDDDPDFTGLQPLTQEQFHAFVVTADAQPIEPGTDPQRDIDEDYDKYFESLCSRNPNALGLGMFTYPSQAAAFEQLFMDVAQNCPTPADGLDRARGQVAWRMAKTQLAVTELEPDAGSKFCDQLQATDDITPTVVAEAVGALKLVKGSAKEFVKFGVSLLILNCHQVLDDIGV
jgi:hypothetical protein